jgi:hypothetical protein
MNTPVGLMFLRGAFYDSASGCQSQRCGKRLSRVLSSIPSFCIFFDNQIFDFGERLKLDAISIAENGTF